MASETTMKAWLQKNAYGQQALATQQKYSVVIDFSLTGRPAQFDGDNTVSFNRALDDIVAASYYVHEMYHVARNKTGNSLKETSGDRNAYVNDAVQEEVDGTVLQLFFFLSLDFMGLLTITNFSDRNSPPMYKEFRDACTIFFNNALKTTGDRTRAIEQERVKANALVKHWIDAPKQQASDISFDPGIRLKAGTRSYRETYNANWGAAHP